MKYSNFVDCFVNVCYIIARVVSPSLPSKTSHSTLQPAWLSLLSVQD